MAAAEKLFECNLEIVVDLIECLFELLPRENIDLFDRGLRVLD